MSLSVDQVTQLIIEHQYWIIFPLSVLEWPVITVIGWFLAKKWITDLVTLFFVVLLGDVVGDLAHYGIGRWGRKGLAKKLVKIEGENPWQLQKVVAYLHENPGKTIITGKLTQAMNSIILIGAGVAGVPMTTFLLYCIVGTIPKIIFLLLIGYFFWSAYDATVDAYISHASSVLLVVTVGILVAGLGYLFFPKKWNR